MAKQTDQNDGMMKTGTSRRSRSGRTGRSNTVPRVMILGLLVVVAGGAALFWPRGGAVPTGIGEHQTVVAVPPSLDESGSTPRSGDVDINAEAAPPLIPEPTEKSVQESPAEKAVETKTTATQPAVGPAPTTENPPRQSQPATNKATAKPEPRVRPRSSGPYVVQAGSFGLADNADKEAARLKAHGWEARVQAGNNSSGEMLFRVWIVFFADRQEAQTFINQNSKYLAGAIPVHR